MSYRKLVLDGKEYEFVIGRTHTKVKGVGVWLNSEIGHLEATRCECCGELMDYLYPGDAPHTRLCVSPEEVKTAIRHKIRPIGVSGRSQRSAKPYINVASSNLALGSKRKV